VIVKERALIDSYQAWKSWCQLDLPKYTPLLQLRICPLEWQDRKTLPLKGKVLIVGRL